MKGNSLISVVVLISLKLIMISGEQNLTRRDARFVRTEDQNYKDFTIQKNKYQDVYFANMNDAWGVDVALVNTSTDDYTTNFCKTDVHHEELNLVYEEKFLKAGEKALSWAQVPIKDYLHIYVLTTKMLIYKFSTLHNLFRNTIDEGHLMYSEMTNLGNL